MPVKFTTDLPPPSNFQVDYIEGDTYTLSWDGDSNNGTYEVLIKVAGNTSFVTDGNTVSAPANSVTTTEYNSANEHVLKINLTTGDVSKETATINSILAGSIVDSEGGVVKNERNGVIMTDK